MRANVGRSDTMRMMKQCIGVKGSNYVEFPRQET